MKHNGYFTFQMIIGAHGAILDAVCMGSPVISRHTVVCRAAQEAGTPHREYIYRKKVNAIFTPL